MFSQCFTLRRLVTPVHDRTRLASSVDTTLDFMACERSGYASSLSFNQMTILFNAIPGPSEILIGVTVSLGGRSELSWLPVRNSIELWPHEIAGHPIRVVVRDDANSAEEAAAIATQFMQDDQVDVLVQFSLSGPAISAAQVATHARTLHLSMSPIGLSPEQTPWTFRLSPPASLMADCLFSHLRTTDIRSLGFIGTADNFGHGWKQEITTLADQSGMLITPSEFYSRDDDDVGMQAARLASADPDAIIIAGPGVTAALPQTALRKSGYSGQLCQVFGADLAALRMLEPELSEGTLMPNSPGAVSAKLPLAAPARQHGQRFVERYLSRFGVLPESQAALTTHDAICILERIIPNALEHAQPRTEAFRNALRRALLSERHIATANGMRSYSEQDPFGVGKDAAVLLVMRSRQWDILHTAE